MKTFKQIFDETKLGKEVIRRELNDNVVKSQLMEKDKSRKMSETFSNKL